MRLQNSFCSIVVYLVQEVRYFYVKIKPPIKIKCRLQFSSSWYVLSGKGNAHHFPCMCWSPFWTISSSWSENFTILLRGHNGFNNLLESHYIFFFAGIRRMKLERYPCLKLERKKLSSTIGTCFYRDSTKFDPGLNLHTWLKRWNSCDFFWQMTTSVGI